MDRVGGRTVTVPLEGRSVGGCSWKSGWEGPFLTSKGEGGGCEIGTFEVVLV